MGNTPKGAGGGGLSAADLRSPSGAPRFKSMEASPATREEERSAKALWEHIEEHFKKTQLTGEVGKSGLRSLFPGLEDEKFDLVYDLFDWDGDTRVDPREFATTMIAITRSHRSLEEQIELAFYMFDKDHSGGLSRDEFRAAIGLTVTSTLQSLLQTRAGLVSFQKHLQSEFSEENIWFAEAALSFGASKPPVDMARANGILEKFVVPGAPQEVNISSSQQSTIMQAFEEAEASGGPVARDVFEEARVEIFKLMERDNFSRFQKDEDKMNELIDSFFQEADTDGDSKISAEEFARFCRSTPEALAFLGDVVRCTKEVAQETVHVRRLSMGGGVAMEAAAEAAAAGGAAAKSEEEGKGM